nr:vegetative cell wall protein gp1-like [Aegilops tauschii subsp. strangulata]
MPAPGPSRAPALYSAASREPCRPAPPAACRCSARRPESRAAGRRRPSPSPPPIQRCPTTRASAAFASSPVAACTAGLAPANASAHRNTAPTSLRSSRRRPRSLRPPRRSPEHPAAVLARIWPTGTRSTSPSNQTASPCPDPSILQTPPPRRRTCPSAPDEIARPPRAIPTSTPVPAPSSTAAAREAHGRPARACAGPEPRPRAPLRRVPRAPPPSSACRLPLLPSPRLPLLRSPPGVPRRRPPPPFSVSATDPAPPADARLRRLRLVAGRRVHRRPRPRERLRSPEHRALVPLVVPSSS